jgi:hypothetical protein
MQTSTGRERPVGVTILAVLAFIGGIFGLLGALALLGLGGVAAAGDAGLGGLTMLFGVLLLVLALIQLAFGYGAWTLKPWAWTLGVAGQVLSLILALVNILTGSDIGSQIIGIAISAIILYYLFTPGVRAAFGRA